MQIMLTVAYDGTNYAGWQFQKNALSVQEVLEDALSRVLGKRTPVTGSSRTDAGVHAIGQRACFTVDSISIPVGKLPYVLNNALPQDVKINRAELVDDDFHPRFMATNKTYSYSIFSGAFPNPLLSRYTCFWPYDLDIDKMRRAAYYIVGTHDFKAFCATGSSAKTTTRTIYRCEVMTEPYIYGGIIKAVVTGNGFLYNMVRILAGTLVYVGQGKIDADAIPDILSSCDRTRAGKTMPPEGLTLIEVGFNPLP